MYITSKNKHGDEERIKRYSIIVDTNILKYTQNSNSNRKESELSEGEETIE